MKLLLLEDDQQYARDFFDFLVENYDIEVDLAYNGLDGFKKAELSSYDIILTDNNMPYMNGVDFIRALRESKGINQHTPVIIASAYRWEIEPTSQIWENVYILEKPFEEKQMDFYLGSILRLRKKVS